MKYQVITVPYEMLDILYIQQEESCFTLYSCFLLSTDTIFYVYCTNSLFRES